MDNSHESALYRIGCMRGHALEFADAAGLPQLGVPHVSGYFGWNSNAERDVKFWVDDITVQTAHRGEGDVR